MVDGVTLADERMQYALNGIKKAIAAASAAGGASTGTGVGYPIPYFGNLGTTYWRADNSAVSTITIPDGSSQTVEDYNLGTNDDDNLDGGGFVTWWLLPNDCAGFNFKVRPVKKNGKYGRPIPFNFDDVSDEERALGFAERTIRGLQPKWVYDITRATATSTSGAKTHNPVEPTKAARVAPQVTAGATRATSLQAWPNPVGGSPAIGYPPYNFSPRYPLYQNPALPAGQGEALARLDLTNYAPLVVRITAVGAAEKERGGTFYPVTCTCTAGIVGSVTLRGFRVGRKPEDYSKYGKQYRRWRHDLTEDERAAGTFVAKVGPFGRAQAKHTWHVTRIHARSWKDDAEQAIYNELYPALVADCAGPDDISIAFAASPSTDVDSAYHKAKSNSEVSSGRVPGAAADGTITADPDDVSAGQATNWQNAQTSDGSSPSDGGAAGKRRVLAVLAPGEEVDGKLAGFVVTTAPDLATEKDSDALIAFSADIQTPGGGASTAGDANATQAVFIFYRKGDTDSRPNYIRKRVDLNPTDAKAELSFHRKIGRGLHMKKMRLRNGISKVDTDLKTQTGGGLTSGLFVAGQTGGAYTDTDAHTGISSVVIADADPGNPESAKAPLKATIGNVGVGGLPVIPKRGIVFVTRKGVTSSPGSLPASDAPTSGDWRAEKEISLGDEPNLAVIASVVREFTAKLRRKKDHWVGLRLYVKGSATPIDSNVLLYTTVSDLPNSNYGLGHGNYVRGGGFLHSKKDVDGAGSVNKPALDWEYWDNLAGSGATDVDDSSGNPIYWVPALRHLVWKFNGGSPKYLAIKLPKVPPGKRFSVSMRLRSNSGTSDSSTFIARICAKGVGSLTTPALHRGTLLNANTGDFVSATSTVDLGTYSTGTQGLYLVLDRNGTSDDQDFQITDIMMNLGDQPLPWEGAGVEANWNQDPATSTTFTSTDAGSYANAGGGNETVPLGDTDWEP